jgi:putative endonuclease
MGGKRRGELGRWGEAQAVRYLEARGCTIVMSNWRCQAGEVDVIARDGDCLAFVEVRTRRGQAYGMPEESITPRKLARMVTVAETFVYEQDWQGDWRLDVIAIQAEGKRVASIEWYQNVPAE